MLKINYFTKRFLPLLLLINLCGCYQDFYILDKDYLQKRELQTKRFDTLNQEKLFLASVQVLQDQGFTILESNTNLGIVTAKQTEEFGFFSQLADRVLGDVVHGALNALFRDDDDPAYDVSMETFVTVFIKADKSSSLVRVSFTRFVTDSEDHTRAETIENKATYKDFFNKLEKYVFLIGHDI